MWLLKTFLRIFPTKVRKILANKRTLHEWRNDVKKIIAIVTFVLLKIMNRWS